MTFGVISPLVKMGGRDRIGWEMEVVFESVIFVRILRTIIASSEESESG